MSSYLRKAVARSGTHDRDARQIQGQTDTLVDLGVEREALLVDEDGGPDGQTLLEESRTVRMARGRDQDDVERLWIGGAVGIDMDIADLGVGWTCG